MTFTYSIKPKLYAAIPPVARPALIAPAPPTVVFRIIPVAAFKPTIPPAPVVRLFVSTLTNTGRLPCSRAFSNTAREEILSIKPSFLSATAPIGYSFNSAADKLVVALIIKFLTTPDCPIW